MAEYLNEDDQVAALKKWWDENGTALVVGLVLVIGGIVGWRVYSDYDQGRNEAASSVYQRYLELRSAASRDEAALNAVTAELDGEYAGTSYQIFSLLHRAADAAGKPDLDAANDLLAKAVDQAGDQYLEDLARVRLARIQHAQGDDAAAISTLGGVKGAGFASYAAEIKGDVLFSQGKREEALSAYKAAAAIEGVDGERPLLKLKIADLTPPGAVPNAR